MEEPQIEPELAPGYDEDSIAPLLQEGISAEVKSQVTNALAAVLGTAEEAVEQFFHAAHLSAQAGIRTVVYDAVEHEILH